MFHFYYWFLPLGLILFCILLHPKKDCCNILLNTLSNPSCRLIFYKITNLLEARELAEKLLTDSMEPTIPNLVIENLCMMERELCIQLALCHKRNLILQWCLRSLLWGGKYDWYLFFHIRVIKIAQLMTDSVLHLANLSESMDNEGSCGLSKRSKRSFQSKSFKVEISYAASIPLKSIAVGLSGAEAENNAFNALRVLDVVLRQQAANRYLYCYSCLMLSC